MKGGGYRGLLGARRFLHQIGLFNCRQQCYVIIYFISGLHKQQDYIMLQVNLVHDWDRGGGGGRGTVICIVKLAK